MNIQNRTWSPDTCKCVITMEMDTDVQTEYVPVQSFTNKEGVESTISFCAIHDKKDLNLSYDACLETNQTKNKLEGIFNLSGKTTRVLTVQEKDMIALLSVATGASMSVESVNIPNEVREKEYKWEVNTDGTVAIDLSSFSQSDKTDLETEINSKLQGKVVTK